MNGFTRAGAHAAALIGVALWLGTVAAQDRLSTTSRRAAGVSPAAIDQGQRSAQPRQARTAVGTYTPSRPGAGTRYLSGSVIVKFRAGTPAATQSAILSLVQGRAMARPSYAAFDLVALGDATLDPEAVAARLAAQPDVEFAQARYRLRPRFRPNDPFYSSQWNLSTLDMERAWDINPGAASSVVVAVLDTGMAFKNIAFDLTQNTPQSIDGVVYPALGTVRLPFAAAPDLGTPDRFVAPFDFIWGDEDPVDMDGHGTHISGTIGQVTNNAIGVAGMAFNIKLMPVKVLDGFWDAYFESPFIGTDDTVARGIRYAVDSGAKILNLSFGRTGPPAPVVRDAINYAVSRGAFVVAAGSNDFANGNPVERIAELAPQINGMVSVGAVGRDRARASYSGTGSYMELAAPGGDASRGGTAAMILQQTYDFNFTDTFLDGPSGFHAPRFDVMNLIYYQGTSMATAHVTGLAALLYQQGITNPAAIEAAIRRSATDLGAPGRDDEYGYGLINPRAALRGLGIGR